METRLRKSAIQNRPNQCEFCGTQFKFKRRGKRFCDDKCPKAAARAAHVIYQAVDEVGGVGFCLKIKIRMGLLQWRCDARWELKATLS